MAPPRKSEILTLERRQLDLKGRHAAGAVYRRYAIVSDADLRAAAPKLVGTIAPDLLDSHRATPQNFSR